MKAKTSFNRKDIEAMKNAISEAEKNTSGEIRVHIEEMCNGDVIARALSVFKELKMDKTKLHNGILFYLAIQSRQFAVIGDSAINDVISDNYWESLKTEAISYFKEEKYSDGLVSVIGKAGIELKKYFPYQKDDINELPNDISFGKE